MPSEDSEKERHNPDSLVHVTSIFEGLSGLQMYTRGKLKEQTIKDLSKLKENDADSQTPQDVSANLLYPPFLKLSQPPVVRFRLGISKKNTVRSLLATKRNRNDITATKKRHRVLALTFPMTIIEEKILRVGGWSLEIARYLKTNNKVDLKAFAVLTSICFANTTLASIQMFWHFSTNEAIGFAFQT
ncbi:hypothetical protein GQX74_013983 [Glossina fuscipes]|nr:hypothetical protein GQX74_013983 [Glossina fuscipes]